MFIILFTMLVRILFITFQGTTALVLNFLYYAKNYVNVIFPQIIFVNQDEQYKKMHANL